MPALPGGSEEKYEVRLLVSRPSFESETSRIQVTGVRHCAWSRDGVADEGCDIGAEGQPWT